MTGSWPHPFEKIVRFRRGGAVFAGIEVRAQIMARNAGGFLDLEDIFRPARLAGCEPLRDCPLCLANKRGEQLLRTNRLDGASQSDRLIVLTGTGVVAVHDFGNNPGVMDCKSQNPIRPEYSSG